MARRNYGGVGTDPVAVAEIRDTKRDSTIVVKYHRKDRYFYARVDEQTFRGATQTEVEDAVNVHLGQQAATLAWIPVIVWDDDSSTLAYAAGRHEVAWDGVYWHVRPYGCANPREMGKPIEKRGTHYAKDKGPAEFGVPGVYRYKSYGGEHAVHYLAYDEHTWALLEACRSAERGHDALVRPVLAALVAGDLAPLADLAALGEAYRLFDPREQARDDDENEEGGDEA